LTLCAQVAIAVPSLEVRGADFVNPRTGNRFLVNGVAYQPAGSSGYNPGSDPLTDGAACLRDAALMQRLGINTIRVYNLDPAVNHDLCASIFNAVGIYMALDVNSPLPNESLDRVSPWNSYNVAYLNRTFAVIEAFKNYPNTLLFFSGNEVISDVSTGGRVPPYIRVSFLDDFSSGLVIVLLQVLEVILEGDLEGCSALSIYLIQMISFSPIDNSV
jgi:hypothetical protein